MKEIVIKIDERILEHLKDGSFGVRPYDRNDLIDAVMNGTPLPEDFSLEDYERYKKDSEDYKQRCLNGVEGE